MVEIFRDMENHYENHTYTDIGTLLLNVYEEYLLSYEKTHEQGTACRYVIRAQMARVRVYKPLLCLIVTRCSFSFL